MMTNQSLSSARPDEATNAEWEMLQPSKTFYDSSRELIHGNTTIGLMFSEENDRHRVTLVAI